MPRVLVNMSASTVFLPVNKLHRGSLSKFGNRIGTFSGIGTMAKLVRDSCGLARGVSIGIPMTLPETSEGWCTTFGLLSEKKRGCGVSCVVGG